VTQEKKIMWLFKQYQYPWGLIVMKLSDLELEITKIL